MYEVQQLLFFAVHFIVAKRVGRDRVNVAVFITQQNWHHIQCLRELSS